MDKTFGCGELHPDVPLTKPAEPNPSATDVSRGGGRGVAAPETTVTALNEGEARLAFALPARPTAKEMVALAETWRPWRAVAARQLWTYYAFTKRREYIPI